MKRYEKPELAPPKTPPKKKRGLKKVLSDLGQALKLPPVSTKKRKPSISRYGDPAARDSLMSQGYTELDLLEKRKPVPTPSQKKK